MMLWLFLAVTLAGCRGGVLPSSPSLLTSPTKPALKLKCGEDMMMFPRCQCVNETGDWDGKDDTERCANGVDICEELKTWKPEIMKSGICATKKELPCCSQMWSTYYQLCRYGDLIADIAYPHCGKDGYYGRMRCLGMIPCFCVDENGKRTTKYRVENDCKGGEEQPDTDNYDDNNDSGDDDEQPDTDDYSYDDNNAYNDKNAYDDNNSYDDNNAYDDNNDSEGDEEQPDTDNNDEMDKQKAAKTKDKAELQGRIILQG